MATSSLTAPEGTIDIVRTTDLTVATHMTAPEASINVIHTTNLTASEDVMADNMLGMLGTYLSSNCPIEHNLLSTFLGEGEGGAIHYSWIRYPITIQSVMSDIFTLGVEGFEFVPSHVWPFRPALP